MAPSVPGLHGSVWRTTANEFEEWEVEFSFKAHGQSYLGGKGLAFWYTKDRAVEGPIFGSKNQWTGLGVFMDTSDPANQRVTPVIYGIMNDGTRSFPKKPTANSFGGCLRDYKNSPVPVVVRVSYFGKTLKVAVDTLNRGYKMTTCFEQKDLTLPTGYHFGFSALAAEIGTPDDHDLLSLEVYQVSPPQKTKKPFRPHEEAMIKKGGAVKVDETDKQVFEEVQKIVEEREQKLKEEQDGGPGSLSPGQIVATMSDTQYRIIESLNAIHNKLESLGAPMEAPESMSAGLAEVNVKLNSMARSLHAMENVVQGLVDHIMKQGGTKNMPDIAGVLKEELHTLKSKMEDMDTRQSFQHHLTQSRLKKSHSWISYAVVLLIIVQFVGLTAYHWYKKRVERNEKKFI
ncbi:hypothetical protein BGZ65_005514 [Modicella reniformis]|uniref:L-type lectin-like domain-containing protein n=1 Tax=Modicella reniformis TaxID=1440133 RepID=A0A9P6LYF1_9FUNG|nr:hypothetical protein BGZ65_005514 [Modicella reniformis]